MVEDSGRFDALLQEDRTFPPSEAFKAQANISDPNVYEEAKRDPEAFWAKFAEELDFQRERIVGWGLAQAVLSAWWSFEDSGHVWDEAITCAELLATH